MNKVDFIKKEFKNNYVDAGPENGILQSGKKPEKFKYHGSSTHCRNFLYTLTKMLKPKYFLEIGSWHYESSNAVAKAMDEMYGEDGEGVIDSFDIMMGGYDGQVQYEPKSKRINPRFWYPHHTNFDQWKYNSDIVFKDFVNLSNDEISEKNIKILNQALSEIPSKPSAYDIIFIDGDHSFEGAKQDFKVAKSVSNENTLFVVDNIWDARLEEVRDWFDSLNYVKWNFEEWNDEHYKDNMVQDSGIFILEKIDTTKGDYNE